MQNSVLIKNSNISATASNSLAYLSLTGNFTINSVERSFGVKRYI